MMKSDSLINSGRMSSVNNLSKSMHKKKDFAIDPQFLDILRSVND